MIRVHIHSDCPFFAGSERMLALILNNPDFFPNYSFSASFRETPEYAAGFESLIKIQIPVYKMRMQVLGFLLDSPSASSTSRLLKKIAYFIFQPCLFISALIKIFLILKNSKPDVLHVNNGGYPGALSARAAIVAAGMCGIKSILMVVNNQAVEYNRASRFLDSPLDYLVSRLTSTFVTGSKSSITQLARVLGLSSEKQTVIPNGIEKLQCTEGENDFKERLDLQDFRGLIFGVVANHELRKGHAYLIEATSLIVDTLSKSEINNFVVLIEGFGVETQRLKSQVLDKDLTHYIKFVGQEPKIGDFIGNIDCLILPSIYNEDFPNVVIEAMALGKPVISTNVAGIPEQILADVSGFLVEPQDVQGLAECMQNLISHPEKLKIMGSAGYDRYETFFSKETALVKYAELYKSLLNRKG